MNAIAPSKKPDHAIVNAFGIVEAPKRWRGHPVYVIYYWSVCCRYSQLKRQRWPAPGERFQVKVFPHERDAWPALNGIKAVVLELMPDRTVKVMEL